MLDMRCCRRRLPLNFCNALQSMVLSCDHKVFPKDKFRISSVSNSTFYTAHQSTESYISDAHTQQSLGIDTPLSHAWVRWVSFILTVMTACFWVVTDCLHEVLDATINRFGMCRGLRVGEWIMISGWSGGLGWGFIVIKGSVCLCWWLSFRLREGMVWSWDCREGEVTVEGRFCFSCSWFKCYVPMIKCSKRKRFI